MKLTNSNGVSSSIQIDAKANNRDGVKLNFCSANKETTIEMSLQEFRDIVRAVNNRYEDRVKSLSGEVDEMWRFNKLYPEYETFWDYLEG